MEHKNVNFNGQELVSKLRQELATAAVKLQYECPHKDTQGAMTVIPFNDFIAQGYSTTLSDNIRNDKEMIDYTSCCVLCNAALLGKPIDMKEIDEALYILKSMLHQIKMLSSNTDSEELKLVAGCFDLVGTIEYVANTTYSALLRLMANDQNSGGQNNSAPRKSPKGGFSTRI